MFNNIFNTKHSKDFYKGKSFHFAGQWTTGQHYNNDDYVIDFVAYDNALLACKQSHLSTNSKEPVLQKDSYGNIIGVTSPYWDFVMSGIDKTDIKIALQILSAKIEEIDTDIEDKANVDFFTLETSQGLKFLVVENTILVEVKQLNLEELFLVTNSTDDYSNTKIIALNDMNLEELNVRFYFENSFLVVWAPTGADVKVFAIDNKPFSAEVVSSVSTAEEVEVLTNVSNEVLAAILQNYYSKSEVDGLIPVESGTGTNSVQQKGTGAVASGEGAVAEGSGTTASGASSHAEGSGTKAEGVASHAEGSTYNNIDTSASADAAHAEGAGVVVKGQAAHGEGVLNVAGRTQEEAVAALVDFPNLGGTTEQKVSKLIGFASHSEGSSTQALGTSSHAEGNFTQALVNATHAEGDTTTASGEAAHSEGYKTTASGNQAHAEGYKTTASGNQAHAEGYHTEATANTSHAEGKYTKATSENAHAEGNHTTAKGNASHTEGYYTVANNNVEHAEGQYNVSHSATTEYGSSGNTQHSVGIGTYSQSKNAFEIMQNGDAYLYGVGNYEGNNLKTDTTKPSKTLQTVISEAFTNANMSALEGDYGYIKNKVGGYYVEVPNADITVNIGSTAFQGDEIEISWDTLQECGVPKSFKDLLIVDGRIMYCTVQDAFGEDWHSGKLYYNLDDDAIYLTILDTDYLDFETFDIHNQTDGELRNGTSIARVHIPRSYLKDVESSNNKIQSVSLTNPSIHNYPSEKAVADILKPAIIDGSVNSNNEFEPSPEFTRAEWDEIANDYKLGRTIILNADFNETQCHSTVISYYDDLSYMSVLIGTTIVVWKRPLN